MFSQRVLEVLLLYYCSIAKSYPSLKAFDVILNGALNSTKQYIAYEEAFTLTACNRTVIPIRNFPEHY